MRKLLPFICFLSIIHLFAGAQEPISVSRGARPYININSLPLSAFEAGKIQIRLSTQLSGSGAIKPQIKSNGEPALGMATLDSIIQTFHISKISRLFDPALTDDKMAARHDAWGFDRWYQLEFSPQTDVRKLVMVFRSLNGLIDCAEPVYRIRRLDDSPPLLNSPDLIPNDPNYAAQWNLHNTGQQNGTAGSDIHMQEAWDIETGKSNVIVDVMDDGIDYNHPDLSANMWSGIGYNFVNNSNLIVPGEHGTHVAGTVAAVNNNGAGVSGIAGGDGTPGNGIRLMSTQIFSSNNNATNVGAAYVWAADHGAAISQNSWTYLQPNIYQQSTLDGIDYFIAHGGGSVMQGGLVIFASGNDNSSDNYYPSCYEPVIAVAATNNQDIRSYYSNYGSYVDICAPGGEQNYNNDPHGILSTGLNGSYIYLQGTSMACPHVSGVAALLLSKLPGRLSPGDLRSILLQSTDDIYPLNASYYAGKLGTGRLNAFKAIQIAANRATQPAISGVSGFTAQNSCPDINLSWIPNTSGDEVMIAYSREQLFGYPITAYSLGDTINGGGIIIYKGSQSTFSFPLPSDSSRLYFRIWAVRNETNYSPGQDAVINSPFSLQSLDAVPDNASILLSWIKKCPSYPVIIAANDQSSFGIPSGPLAPGDLIAGGGKIVYVGNADSFIDTNPFPGTNYYRVWTIDQNNSYSQYHLDLAVCFGNAASPLTEGFESPAFPPGGWQIINPDAGSISWEKTVAAAKSGMASAIMPCYSYSSPGQQDYLLSPAMFSGDADSVILSFDMAYRQYSADFSDTLAIVVSTDCGNHFNTVWKKGGADLATVAGTYSSAGFVPSANDWKNIRINLQPSIGTQQRFIAGFRSTNQYGQNIYLDNINLELQQAVTVDAQLKQISYPADRICGGSFSPKIIISNQGTISLDSLQIVLRMDEEVATVIKWTGQLSKGQTAQINTADYAISYSNLQPGLHHLTCYTSLPNGGADERVSNDTSRIVFTMLQPQPPPLDESFETNLAGPPAGWTITSSGMGYTWEPTRRAALDQQSSFWIRNYRFNSNSNKDDLYSPIIQLDAPDSVYLSFYLAYTNYNAAGASNPPDTLEILVTKDCGSSFSSVLKKWGSQLSTTDPVNPPQFSTDDTVGFVPRASEWKKVWIDLSAYLQPKDQFQVVFRNSSEKGNNTFIDKVGISAVTLPNALKEKGYLIAPNPFNHVFTIRHVTAPVHLKGIQISNSTGQQVMLRSFNGQAASNIYVDMGRYPDGLYLLKLIYDDKVITERIIKTR